MAEQSTIEHIRYRIRRDASGVVAWFRNSWQSSRRFRWLAGTLGIGCPRRRLAGSDRWMEAERKRMDCGS